MSLKKRYIAFQDYNLDFTYRQVEIFQEMWEQGYKPSAIAKKILCKKIEVELLAIDLSLKNEIKPRKNGIEGTKELPDDKIRIEV